MISFRIAGLFLLLTALVAGPGMGQMESAAAVVVSPEAVVGAPEGPPLSGEALDKRTQKLAEIMRCPVCQALSVADSPTTSALAMREEARDLLAAGYSEGQVLEYFEKSYGEFILLSPKKKGFNWLVWLAPIVVLLGGAAFILGRAGNRGKDGSTAGRTPDPEDDELAEYAKRVRQEVAE